MIVFGDGEQNIYNRQTEGQSRMPQINGFGSNNPWKNVGERISMRIFNPAIANLASDFSLKFKNSDKQLKIDNDKIDEIFNYYDYKIKYWNVGTSATHLSITQNIEWILREYNLNTKDVVVIGQSINLLRSIEHELQKRYERQTMTTFESKEVFDNLKKLVSSPTLLELDLKAIRRVAKVHFTTDTDKLKLATIHSFKGWESKTVILIIQPEAELKNKNEENEDGYFIQSRENIPAHIYTAIPRARENLFILNLGNQKYHDFFKNHIKND